MFLVFNCSTLDRDITSLSKSFSLLQGYNSGSQGVDKWQKPSALVSKESVWSGGGRGTQKTWPRVRKREKIEASPLQPNVTMWGHSLILPDLHIFKENPENWFSR